MRAPALPSLLLAVAACGTAPPSARAPAPEPAPSPAPGVTMPGPGPARGERAVRLNQGCVSCHADVAAEWRGSPHQLADRDPVYQRALAIEPLPFCRSCHAPEADPSGPASEPLSELGIGCVTCHLAGDAVLAAPASGRSAGGAPHAIVRDARFAGVSACAGCHEFAFPDSVLRARPELMQSTVSEHAKSTFSEQPCASCHMARSARRRHHGFGAQRSDAALAESLHVVAERVDAGRVRMTLTTRNVGHAFPTGDLFRRLELSVEAVGDDHASVASRVRYLARHYRPLALKGSPRRVASDDRLGVDGQPSAVVELDLGAEAAGWPLVWRVAYQRVQHPAGIDDESAVVASEVTLAEGELPREAE